jgi:DNA-directed RNA polymerase specialized sigma24 family protein
MSTLLEDPPAATPAIRDDPLLALAIAGERSAQDHFCRRFLPQVRRWLRSRWRGAVLASLVDDAAQEVFLECCRPGGALSRIDRGRRVRIVAYLHGVVGNVAARVERREARQLARRARYRTGWLCRPTDGEAAIDAVARAALRAAVRAAVQALSLEPATAGHSLAELVQLHFGAAQPVRAIAAAWQLPAARVHALRRRACRRLRRRLARTLSAPD